MGYSKRAFHIGTSLFYGSLSQYIGGIHMKKFWLILLTCAMTVCLALGISACGGSEGGGTKHVHELIRHGAKEPTCTEDGNELYFECKQCHMLFTDESCLEQTTLFDVQKQATGHKAKSEWEQGEVTHYHVCEVCGEKLSETEAEHDFGTGNVCTICYHVKEGVSVDLQYQLNEDGVSYSVVGLGSCTDTDVVIPSIYEQLPVTSIGERAFYNCIELTSIVIPDSVTSIENEAFARCLKLIQIWNYSELPIERGSEEFGYIAYYAKHVYTGQEEGFQTVTDEGYIFYEEGDEHYLLGYRENQTELRLPETSPTGSDYAIYQYAFYWGSSLINIEIPNSVTEIGGSAFYGCSGLTSITIPDGVTSIGESAFSSCHGLESVTIGSGVTSIGSSAFSNCGGLTGE